VDSFQTALNNTGHLVGEKYMCEAGKQTRMTTAWHAQVTLPAEESLQNCGHGHVAALLISQTTQ
jgi:hypothetical protein